MAEQHGAAQLARSPRRDVTPQLHTGPEPVIASGRFGADGVLRATYVLRQRTTFHARFAGDALYEPQVVARTATAGLLLRQRLGGHTAYADGVHYYSGLATPVLHVAVHPSRPGSCVTARLQAYHPTGWRTVAAPACMALGWDSTARFVFDGA